MEGRRMTGRDLMWRTAGGLLFAGGCAASLLARDGSPWALLRFAAAIIGIVLVLNGKGVGVVIRAERRGHCDTAAAVHAARIRRRGQNTDGFGV
jgi:hypothetical protein